MKKAFIYKITSPKNKIYIGSTFNFERRKREYKCNSNSRSKQIRLHNSILKHGFDNHVFEIIAECDIIDRNKIENYYGNIYEVLGSNGLNCRLPLHEKYACMSDDTKMKISIANKGKNGWKHTLDARKKISISVRGRVMSEDTKSKISKINKGRKHSQIAKQNMSKAQNKIILNTENGIFYLGVHDAADSINKSRTHLYRMLTGLRTNKTFLKYV